MLKNTRSYKLINVEKMIQLLYVKNLLSFQCITGFIPNADGHHPLGGRFDSAARPPRHSAQQPQTLHNQLYGPNYYTNGVSTTARPYAATSHVPRSLDYEHGYPVQRFGRQYK